jgi:hypothetical protein
MIMTSIGSGCNQQAFYSNISLIDYTSLLIILVVHKSGRILRLEFENVT